MSNRPDTADVHVNGLLSNISVGYINEGYIADKVFPIIGSEKQSNLIAAYTKADFLIDSADVRAPGTVAREKGWTVDNTTSFFCINYAIRKAIPDEIRDNADRPYDMDRDATLYVTDKIMMKRETKFAAAVNAASVWTTATTVGVKWSDFASSDPINDIFTGCRAIQQLIARRPNTLVMGQIVYDRLRVHPDFLELVKYTSTNRIPSKADMAAALDIGNLLVSEAVYESAAEGATSSILPIWDDDAVLLYVAPGASLFNPSAGYTFVWQTSMGGNQYIRRYRIDERKTDYVEAQAYFDIKVLAADSGVRFADCVD